MTNDALLQKEIAALLFENLNIEASSPDDDLIETGVIDRKSVV